MVPQVLQVPLEQLDHLEHPETVVSRVHLVIRDSLVQWDPVAVLVSRELPDFRETKDTPDRPEELEQLVTLDKQAQQVFLETLDIPDSRVGRAWLVR
jgi:hypothetical protein